MAVEVLISLKRFLYGLKSFIKFQLSLFLLAKICELYLRFNLKVQYWINRKKNIYIYLVIFKGYDRNPQITYTYQDTIASSEYTEGLSSYSSTDKHSIFGILCRRIRGK